MFVSFGNIKSAATVSIGKGWLNEHSDSLFLLNLKCVSVQTVFVLLSVRSQLYIPTSIKFMYFEELFEKDTHSNLRHTYKCIQMKKDNNFYYVNKVSARKTADVDRKL